MLELRRGAGLGPTPRPRGSGLGDRARRGQGDLGLAVRLEDPGLDEDLRYSSLIVFRKGRQEDNEPSFVPVTRWLRLPQGVFIEGDLNQSESPGGTIPQLGGKAAGTLAVLRFDRFGKLYQTEDNAVVKVGQKADPRGPFMGGSDKHFEITVQALTGRAMIADKARGD